MPQQQGISFLPTLPILGLGLLAVVVTAVLCWVAWHNSGYRKATGILELLRFALVGLIVATLCQPEWLETRTPDQRPTLAVLWDQSHSMKTRDVIDAENSSGEPKSRAETIEPLLAEAIWKPADDEPDNELNVVLEPFSSKLVPAEEATDLNAGLSQVLENHRTFARWWCCPTVIGMSASHRLKPPHGFE